MARTRPVRRYSDISKAKVVFVAVMLCALHVTPVAAQWIDGKSVVVQGLDKITARITTLTTSIDAPLRFGTLELTVNRCAFRPPEDPPENVAFLTIFDQGHDPSLAPKPVFAGWMFSSSPAVSAMEHPVYDITLLK
ncbi:MAG: DUF2155 domain-containing protein, partial [Candidatus Puniceispirillum sp.]